MLSFHRELDFDEMHRARDYDYHSRWCNHLTSNLFRKQRRQFIISTRSYRINILDSSRSGFSSLIRDLVFSCTETTDSSSRCLSQSRWNISQLSVSIVDWILSLRTFSNTFRSRISFLEKRLVFRMNFSQKRTFLKQKVFTRKRIFCLESSYSPEP